MRAVGLVIVSLGMSVHAASAEPKLQSPSASYGAAVPPLASGGVLYEQTPASPDLMLNAASQEFPDAPGFTIFAADDFDVVDGPGWNVQHLRSFFTTGNGSGLDPLGMRWIIWDDDGPGGVPGTELMNVLGGTYDVDTGLAEIDLAGAGMDIDLSTGSYWLTTQIVGEIGIFGQEFQLGSLDGEASSNFHWNNPGGEFGLPAGWVDANGTMDPDTGEPFSPVANLAFQISGAVIPEPATIGLIVLGALTLLRRHDR